MAKTRKIDPAKEEEITRTQWARYERARDNGHLDYVEMALKCDEYYQGDQWDPDDQAVLENEGRPPLRSTRFCLRLIQFWANSRPAERTLSSSPVAVATRK